MNPRIVAEKVAKLSVFFEQLSKTAPEIRDAMRHLQSQAKVGAVDPQHLDSIRRGLFTDRLTGGVMGNQAAYEDFEEGIKRGYNAGGVHVRMDANDFKTINSMHGYATGDSAIKTLGENVRSAVDESIGQSKSKLFRLGGDEFHLWAPDHESAARFVRHLRGKLSSLAPLKGTHNWSMSYGFGHSPQHSDEALNEAKKAKKAAQHPTGQAEHYAHSLVPGHEGAIPLAAPLTRFNVA